MLPEDLHLHICTKYVLYIAIDYPYRYWALFTQKREAFVYYLSEMKLNIDTLLTQSRIEKRTASK